MATLITDSDSCTGTEGITRLAHHHGHTRPHHPTPPPPETPPPGPRTRGPKLLVLPEAGPRQFTRAVTGGD